MSINLIWLFVATIVVCIGIMLFSAAGFELIHRIHQLYIKLTRRKK